jgi:hypothetical protein
MENKRNRYLLIAALSGSALLIACACVVAAGILGVSIISGPLSEELGVDLFSFNPTSTPEILRPTPQGPSVGVNELGSQTVPQETLKTLHDTEVPPNDLYELAERLEGKETSPTVSPTSELVPGAQFFWVSNVDTSRNFQVSMRYVSHTCILDPGRGRI